jgi:hypothetical protein
MRRGLILSAGLGVPAAMVYLYAFKPGAGMFFPPCWLHSLTGLHCPGCGATRSLHALLHGDLLQAAAFNVLFVMFLPFLLYGLVCWVYRLWYRLPRPASRLPRWCWPCIAAGIILFGILRNLPFEPFSLLAPHQL